MIAIYDRKTGNLIKTVKTHMGWVNFNEAEYNKYLKKCAKKNIVPVSEPVFSYTHYSLSTIITF